MCKEGQVWPGKLNLIAENGTVSLEAKREKRKRLGKCFFCNADDVQLHLEAYVNEGQIVGKERSKL